jgi:hypothetical protein
MQHQSRPHIWECFVGLTLGAMMLTGLVTAQSVPPQVVPPLAPGTFHVTATEHELSLEANDAPVATIFAEIGRQTGIPMVVHNGVHETITIALDRVPLYEALTRLAKNIVIRTAQGPSAPPRRIAQVYVLAPGQARPPEVDSHPTQPEAPGTTDTATRPAPFQFTFDPSQHMQRSP